MRKDWLRVLKEIADEVYSTVSPLIGTEVSKKIVGIGAGGDVTKQIDALAEKLIIQRLKESQISCILVGEECGTIKIGETPEAYVVVDSVDGTTNAIRGLNFSSTSMAVSPLDSLHSVEFAIVMRLDNGKAYTALKGNGARYNGEKISPSKVTSLEDAVIAVDISRSPENVERIMPLLKASNHIRCLGSAALEICHVASGQLDASVDIRGKLRTTDIAAAMLILKEAGGVILEPGGEELKDVPLTVINRFSLVAAANMELFHAVVQKIGER